ncbi:glutathione S-transferase family protein [Pseudanabaena sp. FACHB-2040]|uniref:glutathione S-transferase family protein n=1 Tax=Pseudanabaena sp. FACHB-2040 TaxID=2692859 RepID=UPI001689C4C6|nr:glutathione S-transferase family protein [Pseudanabaena sp. FACHB-2040]MBD2257885.1 glutathione S-transferase family protein [Pseudanabaena sp. FACHB-2040]
MLELYQFEASHYCEKVRLILDYKQLPYRKIEVTPGVGQIDLFRLSGQRLVPVLKDGDSVVADSTAIANYLESNYPERPILPVDPLGKGLCLLMEEWADESIGLNARKAMIGAFNQHPNFRTAILPSSAPDLLRNLVSSVPGDVLNLLSTGIGFGADAVKSATDALKQNLEALCLILQTRPYLVSDYPTLADFAVAGLTMYIKFPPSRYVDLPPGICDKGVPGLVDDPAFRPFFEWRDRLYADYRKIQEATPASNRSSGSGPTSISID